MGHTPLLPFHRNLDLTRFGERLGQHHVVLFGDTPVTRGIVEITPRADRDVRLVSADEVRAGLDRAAVAERRPSRLDRVCL